MKLRYAFLMLVLAPSAAFAQLTPSDTLAFPDGYVYPRIDVTAPASIAATLSNYTITDIPSPPYTIPDPAVSLVVGTSIWLYVSAEGDSVALGAYPTAEGVSGNVVLALTAEGNPAFGCDGSPELTNDIDNAADIAGNIGMIARGPIATGTTACGFFLKAQRLLAAGATGVIIYNTSDRPTDTIGNMSGGVEGDTPVTVPATLLTWDIAEPIFNELAAGNTVSASISCDDTAESTQNCSQVPSAGEGGPSASGAGLFLTGENPTSSTARLQVRTPAAEAVTVTAYNMLGQRVATLFQGAVLGQQEVTLTTTNLPTGSYFVRAVGETFTQTQQITVVR